MSKVIVVTSGKGGVGKTTTSANVATGLALKGFKTCVIDFDIGLRNLDLIMGVEKRVVYDFIQVIQNRAKLQQALIKDKNVEGLFILAASQTQEKEALDKVRVGEIINELKEMGFEYIICDSPAGIEHGALMASYYADIALVTTNPEISSIHDSDRMIGVLNSKCQRTELGLEPMTMYLVINRFDPARVEKGHMLNIEQMLDHLSIPLIGVIPESKKVLEASNTGKPIILDAKTRVAMAYSDLVERLTGHETKYRFTEVERKGLFAKIFGKGEG